MNTPSTSQQPSVRSRLSQYLLALMLVPVLAFIAGTVHFSVTECNDPGFDGECDLARVEGILWAAGVVILVLVGAVIAEVAFARQRRSQRIRPEGHQG